MFGKEDADMNAARSRIYLFFKKICDFYGAVFLLFILSPLILLTAFLLLLLNRAVIYAKPRIGFQSRSFTILKFVTMVPNSHNMTYGTMTIGNDPRIIPIGRILRKLKI